MFLTMPFFPPSALPKEEVATEEEITVLWLPGEDGPQEVEHHQEEHQEEELLQEEYLHLLGDEDPTSL